MSHDAFLSAIFAAPDDDTPRLVYADWLDEHGDPDRAEFIRVQCDLARLDDADPRRPGLEDREHELLSEHEPAWLGAVETGIDKATEWAFRRGFADQVTGDTLFGLQDFLESVGRRHPLTRLRGVMAHYAEGSDDLIFSLRSGRAERVQSLDLSGGTWTLEPGGWSSAGKALDDAVLPRLRELDLSNLPGLSHAARLFAGKPVVRRLTSLALGGRTGPGFQWADAANETLDVPAFVTALADAPLEDLSAFDCGLTGDGLRELLQAPFAGRLKRLDISDNPIAPDAYRAFQSADRDLRLDALDVSGTPLAGISLDPLLRSRACDTLRELEMNRCGSARRNMEVLADSAFWSHAHALHLHGGTIPASTLEPLVGSAGPPALRRLDLGDNYLRSAGVRELCGAAWVRSLTWLTLSRNYLDDDALFALADAPLRHLRTLHLAHNSVSDGERIVVTDRGVDALAVSPTLAAVRILTLSYTGVGDRSLEAVMTAPHWRLSGLGMAGCDLSPPAIAALAGNPRLARLEWLDLSGNPRLSGDTLLPLAESPHLSRLCELDIGGVYAGDRTRQALRGRLGPRLSE